MSQLDILLITPPSRRQIYQGLSDDLAAIEPPVWSGLIAKFLMRKGYAVEILDAEADGLDFDGTAAQIANCAPRVAAFVVYGQQPSASTQCMPAAREVSKRLGQIDAEIYTLVMGTHASALPERTLREEPYDFVCQGEGPYTLESLLSCLQAGSEDWSSVPGLWFRDGSALRRGPTAQKIQNLDSELPMQAWDLLDLKKYRAHNWHCFDRMDRRSPYASIQTSLGCPFRCSFCCINAPFGGTGIRYWSPECVVAQIDYLVQEFAVENIKIPDEMFVLNERHVLGICDALIDRGYNLNIWAYARVDTIKSRHLEKLKRAGFNWIALGIESASEHVRDQVQKGKFAGGDIERVVREVREAGISVCANYIFGLPDDTRASMQETLQMALRLNTEWANFYCAMAYPGSKLFESAIRTGARLPDDWSGYSQHSYDTLPLATEALSGSEVLAFRDRAFTEYYSAGRYVDMIRNKFGEHAVEHIEKMTARSLPRKNLPSADAALSGL